jgi:aspartate aminotransferase
MLTETITERKLQASAMAESLIGSEIIKLAAEINEKIKQGEKIYNFTIGDFDSKIFPIPVELRNEIINAYMAGHTNYPAGNGEAELRKHVASFIEHYQGLKYKPEEFLISGGARPLIYAIYKTVLDANDKVIFPVPSWNNNHYCHLTSAQQILIDALPQNNFMPTAASIKPHLKDATLIALCSPLNPTGTVFTENNLREICELVLEENNRRSASQKPLYVMYDQIYWMLTAGNTRHFDPVSLYPEMRNYTIYVDGLSKAFAATGVRVGWAFGPFAIIDKMKSILSHVGAWSPKAEQVATAKYLSDQTAMNNYLSHFKSEVNKRLIGFYEGFEKLKAEGLPVEAIEPQGAIYLTVRFNIIGKKTPEGDVIANSSNITHYLINKAKTAMVPFSAFGAKDSSDWFRLSIGTSKVEDIDTVIDLIANALRQLK